MKQKDDLKLDHKQLTQWYKKNRRDLPWRKNKDPYKIWLSEVMLQQTTVVAVIPYFEKFITKFPTVHDLAEAPEAEVLEAWAGLGYYSRARNLHKAAKELSVHGFPKSADELIKLSGFGPYTSRAVASIAFKEPVGVLDGNVIRILSRRYGLKIEWWNTSGRQQLQSRSDELAALGESDILNQAMMELGATVCTPQKVMCLMCPWNTRCVARDKNHIELLPLKKPRKKLSVWVWDVDLIEKNGQYALIKNNYAPFLKGQMIFPGAIGEQESKPKDYDVKHNITHHDIYIRINHKKTLRDKDVLWASPKEFKKINPSSVLQKILHRVGE